MQSGETTRKIKKGLTIVAIIAAILIVFGLVQRYLHYLSLVEQAQDNAVPAVELIHPKTAPPQQTLSLPANISAWYATPIYAQVSGYVKMWYRDIGAHVKAGELLAEIDTPGLDAQYQSARASYDVAQARYKLAVITSRRWRALQGTQAVSQQEVDVKSADADAQKAQVEASYYNQEHFGALEKFKRIVAPFDGIVTSRKADVGDYVNAGRGDVNSRGDVSELFSVADVHAMRVFVSIPQDYAGLLANKPEAQLHVLQYPNRVFEASFLTTAAAFDPTTRTVKTELVLNNKEGLLWPNSYATVTFIVPIDPNHIVIPEGAIIFRRDGTQVACVDKAQHVHLKNVSLGRNLGNDVEVMSGISRDDFIVNNPEAGLLEGQAVRVVPGTPGYNAPLKEDSSKPQSEAQVKSDAPKPAATSSEKPDASRSQPNTPVKADTPKPASNSSEKADASRSQSGAQVKSDAPKPASTSPEKPDASRSQPNTPVKADTPKPAANSSEKTDASKSQSEAQVKSDAQKPAGTSPENPDVSKSQSTTSVKAETPKSAANSSEKANNSKSQVTATKQSGRHAPEEHASVTKNSEARSAKSVSKSPHT